MFDLVYYKLIFLDFNSLDQSIQQILINRFLDLNKFKSFISSNILNTDRYMIEDLELLYLTDKIGAIKSALAWKTFVSIKNENILISYMIQRDYEANASTILFSFYNVKDGNLLSLIYLVEGKSRAIFFNMDKKHLNIQKIYYAVRKYGMRLK